MITIKLYEENNKLISKEPYSPVVCGNSNYCIDFAFGADWESAKMKLAVFICNGEKTVVDFTGNILNLPAMPNCNKFSFFLITKNAENKQLISAPCEILAVPTTNADNMSEFKPITNFVSELLTKLQNLADGTTKVKNAEFADTATIAKNTSNPNLLLNGDFRINQRGKTSYVCTKNEYTTDRWLGENGLTVTQNTNSITLLNTKTSGDAMLQQKLEDAFSCFAGKTLCFSANINGSLHFVSATIPEATPTSATTIASKQVCDGITLQILYQNTNVLSVGILVSSEKSVVVSFAKLELGTVPTIFSPRPFAEELALCQRYFWKWSSANRYNSSYGELAFGSLTSSSAGLFNIILPNQMRIIPTLGYSQINHFVIRQDQLYKNITGLSIWTYNGPNIVVKADSSGEFENSWTIASFRPNNTTDAYLTFDAEIY